MAEPMEIDPVIEKIDGRSKAARAAKAARENSAASSRGPVRSQPRQADTRQPPRDMPRTGRASVIGRDGEVLTRKRVNGTDPFNIRPEIVPKDWTYQWNVVSVTGNTDIVLDQANGMYETGWRPVPADRHPGEFVARGTRGDIVRGGLRLEERPVELTREARKEEVLLAKQLITDRNDSLKLTGVGKSLGEGMEMGGKYRGTGGSVRMSIDPALDVDAPAHRLAEGE